MCQPHIIIYTHGDTYKVHTHAVLTSLLVVNSRDVPEAANGEGSDQWLLVAIV